MKNNRASGSKYRAFYSMNQYRQSVLRVRNSLVHTNFRINRVDVRRDFFFFWPLATTTIPRVLLQRITSAYCDWEIVALGKWPFFSGILCEISLENVF